MLRTAEHVRQELKNDMALHFQSVIKSIDSSNAASNANISRVEAGLTEKLAAFNAASNANISRVEAGLKEHMVHREVRSLRPYIFIKSVVSVCHYNQLDCLPFVFSGWFGGEDGFRKLCGF